MQRDGQPHLRLAFGQAADAKHEPGGRNGDVPGSEAEPVGGVEGLDGFPDRLVVGKRLSLTHKHDVGHPALLALVQQAGEVEYLPHDLPAGKVAHQPRLPGGAEGTADCATDLRRNTDRVASGASGPTTRGGGGRVAQKHALDGVTVEQLEKNFERQPLVGLGGGNRLQGQDDGQASQSIAQSLGNVAHALQVED